MWEPVLPTDDVPYDESVEITGDVSQMDAAQYLSWVRSQASRLPSVFRVPEPSVLVKADHRMTKQIHVEDVPPCPPHLKPSEEWERQVAHSFSELRLKMEEMESRGPYPREVSVPAMKDRKAWLAFCLGDAEPSVGVQEYKEQAARRLLGEDTMEDGSGQGLDGQRNDENGHGDDDNGDNNGDNDEKDDNGDDDDDGDDDGDSEDMDVAEASGIQEYPPWTGPMGVEPTPKLLLQFDQVLTQRLLCVLVDHLEQPGASLAPALSLWLYSLLARVEKPLHREVQAKIRALFRRCCALRGQLTEAHDARLAALSTLIVVAGLYFGQGEGYAGFRWQRASDSEGDGGESDGESSSSDSASDEEQGTEGLVGASERRELEEGELEE